MGFWFLLNLQNPGVFVPYKKKAAPASPVAVASADDFDCPDIIDKLVNQGIIDFKWAFYAAFDH